MKQTQSTGKLRIEPAVADPIPTSVLRHPLIGEARRFDGAAPPSGWVFAQGQKLDVATNGRLFSVLGTSAGGDGKISFMLPKPAFGLIVAIAGAFPTTPTMLALSGRGMSYTDSLGPGARAAWPRPKKIPENVAAQQAAERRLIASAVRVGPATSAPLSPQLRDRITGAHETARAQAIDALTEGSRARLEGAIQAALDGRNTLQGIATEMQSALTNREANALLGVNATMIRQFNDRWDGNPRPNLILDAADFLVSVAITPEQAHAIARRARTPRH